jgi:hypothetical protein
MTAQNLHHSKFMYEMTALFFQHTCTIRKMTAGVMDGAGQYSGATWADDQADVTCCFSYLQDVTRFKTSKSTITDESLIVVLPSDVTIANDGSYRIVTTDPGFEGTYELTKLAREDMSNYIATLQKVQTP